MHSLCNFLVWFIKFVHMFIFRAQAAGWPPVRTFRKNTMKSCKYVKVAVDGAPYLRKVDLEMYNSYQQLLSALEDMFSCLTIRMYMFNL